MNFGDRLREERNRLVLTQTALGQIGGVQGRAQRLYEQGERRPDSDYLAAVAAAGVDVLYVLTGKRSTPVSNPVDGTVDDSVDGPVVNPVDGLSDFPVRLLGVRRMLGHTQSSIAEMLGMPKRTYCAYETGEMPPSAKLLAALARIGVDTGYLLTGKYSKRSLAQDEQQVLDVYRQLNDQAKAVLTAALSLAVGKTG